MKQISINEIENIRIGNAQNKESGTGCTVVICEKGAVTGLDVRGGGPASRESELLKPTAAAGYINAVLLSGGSAFGLDAAGGVMEYLEERKIGFDVGVTVVPLVAQSCIFDLTVGDMKVRPDRAMAYEACVGKLLGMATAMKAGLGSYAVQIGDLKVGAIVAVNACGDIFDYDTHEIIAGLLTPDMKSFANTEQVIYNMASGKIQFDNKELQNTTIGVVVTNGKFTKAQMNKIATMAHNGYARTINPVHTTMDGDSIYAMSVGEVEADMDMVGTLAANVMGRAVCDAVRKAEDAYGIISANHM